MQRLAVTDRLTYWTAPHPEWQPNPEWPEDVGCVLYAGSDAVVLIDPLVRDDLDTDVWTWLDGEIDAAHAPAVVLLTAPWHKRSTRAVAERYDARVWAHPSARPRVAELPRIDALPADFDVFVPAGVDEGEVAFFIGPEQTLVVAEFFLGTRDGLRVCPSPAMRDRRRFAESLRRLEHLSIERVLVAHGQPILAGGAAAIAAALRSFDATSDSR